MRYSLLLLLVLGGCLWPSESSQLSEGAAKVDAVMADPASTPEQLQAAIDEYQQLAVEMQARLDERTDTVMGALTRVAPNLGDTVLLIGGLLGLNWRRNRTRRAGKNMPEA